MKLVQAALVAIPVFYIAFFGLLAFQQRAMIYFPRADRATAAEAGLERFETLRLRTEDGESVVAWFRPPRSDARPLVLYFHGNGGALADRRNRFAALTDHGYGLLALSWRGYGDSTGAPSEAGLMRDAEAAYGEARRRGYPPERIVLLGESLGTGVATMLAARHEVAALLLDSPYDSILALAGARFPYLPVRLALLDTFRADEAIRHVRAPVLMVVSEDDPVTPAANARLLFALAREPKQLIALPGDNHTALGSPGALVTAMAWLDATVRASPARDPSR